MTYEFIKIIHIISACLLFGTGLGTALYMFSAHRSRDKVIIALAFKNIVKGDWYFTLTSGIVQLATGVLMVYSRQLSWSLLWLWVSFAGYLIAGICWLPVVYLQVELREITKRAVENHQSLPADYYRKFRQWFWLGWPAFISLILVFYLMANRTTKIFFF